MALLLLGTCQRGTAAHHLLVACLCSEIVGVNLVVLLLCHGVALEQLGIALVVLACVVEPYTSLVYAGIRHAHVLSCHADARCRGLAACHFALQVGLSLSQLEAELAVLDYHESVALVYGLIFVESYLLDESAHTGVDGCDVLLHGSVVGELAVAEMHEMIHHKPCSDDEQNEYADVIYGSQKFLVHVVVVIYWC